MMSSEDANKIINFLSAAWMSTEDAEARVEFHRLADELRKTSGQQ
ncbi:N-acetylmuramoyl-L-alanine amidase [Paenibacillus sp. LMG 31460]|uniref:N-acetylmuramoyl-L-alanine amidase n=1 Tax=Paenibacillus germinis TaxID=2654979 RepID=A0ABX1Z7D3_9BACL|nr:N-acetylmuramoyl-L-alanine amidase [Paenibacillus germinis]NOU87803.1 N-acetylmuramoyl-L-alanine amidase [Paenibacillus germinis]